MALRAQLHGSIGGAQTFARAIGLESLARAGRSLALIVNVSFVVAQGGLAARNARSAMERVGVSQTGRRSNIAHALDAGLRPCFHSSIMGPASDAPRSAARNS
jgi:hypothetical protein